MHPLVDGFFSYFTASSLEVERTKVASLRQLQLNEKLAALNSKARQFRDRNLVVSCGFAPWIRFISRMRFVLSCMYCMYVCMYVCMYACMCWILRS